MLQRGGLALALRDDPVLDADRLAAVRVGPARDVARGEDAGRAGLADTRRPSRRDRSRGRPSRPAPGAAARRRRRRPGRRRCVPPLFSVTWRASIARRPCPPRWKTTPCSSCRLRTKSPSCGPSTRSIGRLSGATTCTSMPRARSDAATSRPMKLAPITTARRAVAARAMMARQSPSVRSVCTCGRSMPGNGRRTGSAPVASSSRS